MKIHDDHLYHGAALIQIAEDPQFTAINTFKFGTETSRSAYQINDDIGVYLKYASRPTTAHREYAFTFHEQNLAELSEIAHKVGNVFVAMVCVKAREICCLPYEDLTRLVDARKSAKGTPENQYVILVTVPSNKGFRVYVNKPRVKNKMLGESLIISRTNFPKAIFKRAS